MGLAPERTPTGSVYRSPTNAVFRSIQAVEPPGPSPTQFHPCVLWQPPGGPGTCDSGTPEEYCPDLPFLSVNGTSFLSFEWFYVGMDSYLNYKNFPIDIVLNDPSDVLFTIPTPPCHQYMWECFNAVDGRYIFAGFDDLCGYPEGDDILFGLSLCSLDGVTIPSTGSQRIGMVVQNATWAITEINATEGWVRTGLNWLKGGDAVEIFNQPANNGTYLVDNDSTDDRVFLSGLTQEAGGGTLLFKPAIFRVCGNYTAVSLPAHNLYPAVMRYAGDALNPTFEAADTLIHITGAAPYAGTHPVAAGNISGEVNLPATFWEGPPAPGGTWINNATVLVGATGSFANGIRVTGTIGLYDGFYDASQVFAPGGGFGLQGVVFQGTDSGNIDFRGISFNGDGLPAGYPSQSVTLIVTGTTDYNGTYNDVTALEFSGTSFFSGGDLDSIWFTSNQTGTWEIQDQSLTGNILVTNPSTNPTTFTSARAHKTGTVTDMVTDVSTVIAAGHAVELGWLFSPYESAEYFDDYYDVIGVVAATSFDINVRYTATDAGPYGSGPDVI